MNKIPYLIHYFKINLYGSYQKLLSAIIHSSAKNISLSSSTNISPSSDEKDMFLLLSDEENSYKERKFSLILIFRTRCNKQRNAFSSVVRRTISQMYCILLGIDQQHTKPKRLAKYDSYPVYYYKCLKKNEAYFI